MNVIISKSFNCYIVSKRMACSIWRLHLDSSSEPSASKIINRCIQAFGQTPTELKLEKYDKGGYIATLKFLHNEINTWSEQVIEVIELGQKLGSGWSLFGNIQDEFDAVLSQESGHHIRISGLKWVACQLNYEEKT